MLFGAVTAYVLCRAPEQAALFDVEGKVEVEHLADFHMDGLAVARIGRHPIEFR